MRKSCQLIASAPGQMADHTLGRSCPSTLLHGELELGGHGDAVTTPLSSTYIPRNGSGRGGPAHGTVVRLTWICKCGPVEFPEFPASPRKSPSLTAAPLLSRLGFNVNGWK